MGILNKKNKEPKPKKKKKPFRIEQLYSMREIDEDEFKQPPRPDPLWSVAPVKVKDVEIGNGEPKICVSVLGDTVEDVTIQAENAAQSQADIIEWRADWFEELKNPDIVVSTAEMIKKKAGEKAFLFTLRTDDEGGEADVTPEEYEKINMAVVENGAADMIDVQSVTFGEEADRIIKAAAEKGMKTIASYHDFEETPEEEQMIEMLRGLQYSGADIIKLAVMPHDEEDVMALMNATIMMNNRYTDRPHVNISMGQLGSITRLSSEFINSAIVYVAGSREAAPGQLDIEKMRIMLDGVHERI